MNSTHSLKFRFGLYCVQFGSASDCPISRPLCDERIKPTLPPKFTSFLGVLGRVFYFHHYYPFSFPIAQSLFNYPRLASMNIPFFNPSGLCSKDSLFLCLAYYFTFHVHEGWHGGTRIDGEYTPLDAQKECSGFLPYLVCGVKVYFSLKYCKFKY